ncbi:MAG TPA: hypothetical protein VI756_25750 [Blastocatellia bacterium]
MAISHWFIHPDARERSKEIRAIILVAAAVTVAVFACIAFHTWTKQNKPGGQVETIKQDLADGAKSFKQGMAEIQPLVKGLTRDTKGLRQVEDSAKGLLDTSANQIPPLFANINARANQLGDNLVSVKGLSDEATRQLQTNGDQASALMRRATGTLDDVSPHLTNFAGSLEDSAKGLPATVTQTNTALVSLTGVLNDFRPVEAHASGILAQGELTATDLHTYLHGVMWPNAKPPSCNPGYTLNAYGTACTDALGNKLTPTCPGGYHLKDGVCRRTVLGKVGAGVKDVVVGGFDLGKLYLSAHGPLP